ncbi:MAG TPA: hypothetical protein VNC79_13155 [Mycobacteriales bacterium]|jgi:hypothetical protein|nr:hypothetical protein [Mycobacteriales bacterium]
MITTITPLRRVAVTLAMTGVTAFGAVAIAPAAFADETTTVTEAAPVTDAAPEVVVPTTPPVVEAPPAAPAPAVEPAPAPAPVVTPPPVVIGKDGKPVEKPKVCTAKDLSEYAARVAKADAQAAPLTRAATLLRQASAALRVEATTMNPGHARKALALADASDLAASKLEAQAQAILAKVGGVGCITVAAPGGRF